MKTLLSKFLNYPAHPVTVGLAGVLTTQTAYAMNSAEIQNFTEAAQAGDPVTVIIQIVIGIATLIKLFKKNKNEGNTNG
jgi:hypothetical protein